MPKLLNSAVKNKGEQSPFVSDKQKAKKQIVKKGEYKNVKLR
jgi:hypothetical protein